MQKNSAFNNLLIGEGKRYVVENNLTEKYKDDLTHMYDSYMDIVRVYDEHMEVIWERENIDWVRMPVGTKVLVSDDNKIWYKHLFINYKHEGEFKFNAVDLITRNVAYWKYCKLDDEKNISTHKVEFEEIEEGNKQFNKLVCEPVSNCENCKYVKHIDCDIAWLLDTYDVTDYEGNKVTCEKVNDVFLDFQAHYCDGVCDECYLGTYFNCELRWIFENYIITKEGE